MDSTIEKYIIHLADTSLIQSQRLAEWTGHGPVLELDIAITNIALDYLGQARYFYQYAAEIRNDGATEDSLAYLRDAHEFRNHLLVEIPNGDWGQTILKIFFIAAWQKPLYQQLQNCPDAQVAAITAKSLKEVTYHLRWSSEWVVRLGKGTMESKERMQFGLDELWMYTGALLAQPDEDMGWVDDSALKYEWQKQADDTFGAASLTIPKEKPFQTGGFNGIHTEHLGYILAEMQFLQRAYPDSQW